MALKLDTESLCNTVKATWFGTLYVPYRGVFGEESHLSFRSWPILL